LEAISHEKASEYLSKVFGGPVEVSSIDRLGSGVLGSAYLLDVKVKGRTRRTVTGLGTRGNSKPQTSRGRGYSQNTWPKSIELKFLVIPLSLGA